MIRQEGSPSLGRRFAGPRQISGHSGLRALLVPTEDRVGLNHLQTSPPTGPESAQHDPQEPVALVEAQATRRVLLENRKLVAKREDLRRAARVRKLDATKAKRTTKRELIVVATNGWNPWVFRSDGVFGNHRFEFFAMVDVRGFEPLTPCLQSKLKFNLSRCFGCAYWFEALLRLLQRCSEK
jgi:hypothetical protein